jgi:hypothetical protein
MTLGVNTPTGERECNHQIEPDPAEIAAGTAPALPFSVGATGSLLALRKRQPTT